MQCKRTVIINFTNNDVALKIASFIPDTGSTVLEKALGEMIAHFLVGLSSPLITLSVAVHLLLFSFRRMEITSIIHGYHSRINSDCTYACGNYLFQQLALEIQYDRPTLIVNRQVIAKCGCITLIIKCWFNSPKKSIERSSLFYTYNNSDCRVMEARVTLPTCPDIFSHNVVTLIP